MRNVIRYALACVLCFSLSFVPSYAAETPPGFADLVEKLTPCVVNISTTQKIKDNMPGGIQMFGLPEDSEMPPEFRDFFEHFGMQGQGGGKPVEREVFSLGSGFIIDENGYVVTNNHVISGAEEITVILSDDTKLKAKIIGRDPKTDLALLKVEAGHKLPAAVFGDSDKARVGDWVVTIGNPFGLGGTVTAGIISARARNINAGPFDDFIQTDAPINRGNSGGPMFNMKGEVIGIDTAIYSPSGGSVGIGFAMPSSLAKPILAQLKASGHIDRGWLGIKIQNVTDEIAESLGLKKASGALVTEVSKGSPADKAGVKTGDVITSFDGKEIKEMRNLPRTVAETPIGKTVPFEFWRDGKTKTGTVKIGELKDEEDIETTVPGKDGKPLKGREILGLSLAPLDNEMREKEHLPPDMKGVLITSVRPDSPAVSSGIEAGDVIVQIGDAPIATPKDVSDAVNKARDQGRKFVLIRVLRGPNMSLFVTVQLPNNKELQ